VTAADASVLVLDQNFVANLADTAVCMYRNVPMRPGWPEALACLHQAINVRRVLACPESEFTDTESAVGRDVRERNSAVSHELSGGLRFEHWVSIMERQLVCRIYELLGRTSPWYDGPLDRRLYLRPTSNPPRWDPKIRNLTFRVHWMDDKYGREEPDAGAVAFHWRLTRDAKNDARLVLPATSWEDHAESVALYFLASGPTFQHVYKKWCEARNRYDPDSPDEFAKHLQATHRAMYPGPGRQIGEPLRLPTGNGTGDSPSGCRPASPPGRPDPGG